MEREIVLSSYLNNSSANNTPANFVTNFDRPVILDSNYEYMIGLYRIICTKLSYPLLLGPLQI